MNEIIRDLHRRKSVRAFADRPVPPEVKRAILEAAMAAPPAGNQQMYTILDVTDPALKRRLSETCDHQPFIAEAPVVLIFLADFQKWYDAFSEAGCAPRRPGVGDLVLSVTDAAIAAQNAVTAAQSLGVGSCYIGDVMENCETHRELLHLPEYVFPAAMLVLGYPTQQQLDRPKPARCRLEDVVCENVYHQKTGAELRTMFAGKHPNMTYDEWAQRFCKRKYNSDFSREMTRSVGEYLRSFERADRWHSADDRTGEIITAAKQVRVKSPVPEALPETALVFFMGKGLQHLQEKTPDQWSSRPLPRFLDSGIPVYIHKDGKVCMLHGGYGAPQAADTVEILAELGVKRIVAVGMCGGYGEGVHLGDMILPDRAFVEEGASLHYYSDIRYAEPSPTLLARAAKAFPEARCLPIVTTDAVYRQTFFKENRWREEGAVGVDMETSALFSICRLKGIEAVMLMVVSDKHPLSPEAPADWTWHMPPDRRAHLAEQCLTLAQSL